MRAQSCRFFSNDKLLVRRYDQKLQAVAVRTYFPYASAQAVLFAIKARSEKLQIAADAFPDGIGIFTKSGGEIIASMPPMATA
jgi:hypothetical protein